MEEIQSQSDNYRSSSSSASSPATSRVPSSNFFYLRKPGSLRQPISFEDSPDWGDDTDIDVRVDEGVDSINAATTPGSPTLSKLNSGSLPSPYAHEGVSVTRKVAGASVVWKDLTVMIKSKRKYSDKVIKSSTGYALPGTMTVIMGPAKSGKSTLLRALSEVNEFLSFSVSALLMMVTLKKLATTGCTLIFTLNQSSTEVFGLFDRICLLSNGNTLFFGETLSCLQHFSNAGFPCPIMQSPSDHFLRAINTDFDRIIAMCKNLQDDHGDLSSVNMDTAVAIRTLEATYKSSADAAAVEAMIIKLTEKEGPLLKSKGRAGWATRIAVLTWRSLLIMSREWKYYWLRLVLYMLLALCIGTVFSGLGHSLSSVVGQSDDFSQQL
uniref:Uncharacterized protein n=1 Tax=Chenopodium quinoa TaxID=63459 RepID=A0A803M3G6_CHEQI